MSAFEDEIGIPLPEKVGKKPAKYDFNGMALPTISNDDEKVLASRFFIGATKRSIGISLGKFSKLSSQTFYTEEGTNKDGVKGTRVWRMS